MSPSALLPASTDFFQAVPADQTIFPDGFKTSGQQEPLYSLIKPYEKFPKQITGPTVWTAQDFENNPEKWTYTFTEDEVVEIGAAADKFIQQDIPLTGITKVSSNDCLAVTVLTASVATLSTSQAGVSLARPASDLG
jgi:hypothetical protein